MTDTPAQADDGLDTLFPDKNLTVGGIALTITPIAFGKLPRAIGLLRPLATSFAAAGVARFEGGTMMLAADWPLKLPMIAETGGEALFELLAFMTSRPRAWFDEIDPEEGIRLTIRVFEINKDFFVRRLLPMLQEAGLLAVPAAPAIAAGEPSSQGSSTTDTAAPTSTA